MRTKIESIARRAEKDIIKGYDIQARIEMAIKQALTQDLEPVAVRQSNGKIDVLNGAHIPVDALLYIAPPQRTWVDLTNEELTDLFYNTNLGQESAVSQAIALLKERNA